MGDSFGVVPERTKNETWTDVITFTVDHYDVAADWWYRSLERVDKGLSSTVKWYDSSTIMIAAKSVDKDAQVGGINWFAVFAPLDLGVWIFTAVTIIITGFAYHANDYIMHRQRQEDRDRLGANVFKTYMAFTGHVLFEPRFLPNRLLLSSIALLCLIFVSAYTANLASFLVNDNRKMTIERFPDVMKYDYRVCVWRGGEDTLAIRKAHPDARYVEKENELEMYQGLVSGECEIALVSKESHERYVNKKEYNPTCGLKVVGFPVRVGMASFNLRSSMDLCSSIVREVLDIFLLEITEDGTLDKIKKDCYQGSQDCEMEWKGGKENQSLSLSDFSGIFIMYYSALVLTLILAVLHIVFPKYIKSNINEIFIVRRAASFLRVSVSGIFSRNTKENHQLEGEVNKSDEKENSLEIQLDRKLLKMKSEILDELKFEIRKEAAETKKTLKEMQIFQWENERSF